MAGQILIRALIDRTYEGEKIPSGSTAFVGEEIVAGWIRAGWAELVAAADSPQEAEGEPAGGAPAESNGPRSFDEAFMEAAEALSEETGLNGAQAAALVAAGYLTLDSLEEASEEDLTSVKGIAGGAISRIRAALRNREAGPEPEDQAGS